MDKWRENLIEDDYEEGENPKDEADEDICEENNEEDNNDESDSEVEVCIRCLVLVS